MIKDILVNLGVGQPKDIAAEYAVSIASSFGAHVSGLAFARKPPIGAPYDCASAILDTYWAEQQAGAERAITAFEQAARNAGVLFDSKIVAATAPEAAEAFGHAARHTDLAVVAQARSQDDFLKTTTIESALFGSGRPVVIVPYIQAEGLNPKRVMVCWDGSKSAARAIADALPILRRADQIDVVTIDDTERRNVLPGAQIAEHLARHELRVNLKTVIAPDSDAASALLSEAADNGTTFMVMGGYGHSRFREFVLGGVTREILQSMTVPVLMAH